MSCTLISLDSPSTVSPMLAHPSGAPVTRIYATGFAKAPVPVTTAALAGLDKDLQQRIQYARVRCQQIERAIKAMQVAHLAYKANGRQPRTTAPRVKVAQYESLKRERAMYTLVLRCLVPLKRIAHAIWDQRINTSVTVWGTYQLSEQVLKVIPIGSSWTSELVLDTHAGVQSAGRLAMQAIVARHSGVFGALSVAPDRPELRKHANLRVVPAPAIDDSQQQLYDKIRNSRVLNEAELSTIARMFPTCKP